MPTFYANEIQIADPNDPTKRWHFDLSGLSPGTTTQSQPPASSGQLGATAAAVLTYASGSFTVATETYRLQPRHLKLSGSQRVTLQGTGTLRLC